MQACSWSGGGEEPGAGSAACRDTPKLVLPPGTGSRERAGPKSGREPRAVGRKRQRVKRGRVLTPASHDIFRSSLPRTLSRAALLLPCWLMRWFATSVIHPICLFGIGRIALLQNIEELSVCTARLRPHSSSSNKNARTQAREAAMVIGRKVTSSVACKGSEEVWGHGQTKGRRHRQGS